MHPILIAEDERPIADLIELTLTGAGYTCEQANDGETAADLIAERDYELAILDIMLPKVDGYELLGYLRNVGTPVIFVTAKTTLNDRVRGLRLGADDYLTKPFEPLELVARVESVLRRTGRANVVLQAFGVTLDPAARTVEQNGKPVHLSPREFELLELLMRNRGMTLYREVLYERLWGDDEAFDTRPLDLCITRLRKKLGWKQEICTVFRVGYRLEKEGTAP
ncbi:MAG TPA: response regulator transcription factor [Candidatus Gemmiger excrementigallinarum]|uniref:Stage 0 sporulation protein A homolog n=1 Tax=Candidatus Gemmiger excrementigallinarum TaxID=2838609 RepID=A0A9D2ETD6_9FIRM|nr:response regulator transcription factor [Candidatus Gemmiger excrementigallinarum]